VFEPKLDGFRALAHIDGSAATSPPATDTFSRRDVLSLDGEDVRTRPLLERKRRLRGIMPAVNSRVLYLDHLAERGRDLFRVACDRDLEGVVGKWAHGTYESAGRATFWLKIKNRIDRFIGR
jgi:bifunctional non-homologous end joining protein LigD